MELRPPILRRTSLLVLAALLAAPLAAGVADDERWESWSGLELRARGVVFLSGRIAMQRSDGPAGEDWLETRTSAKFLGASLARARTRTRTGLDGRTVEYIDLQPKRGRRYRFFDDRYEVQKLRPREGRRNSDLRIGAPDADSTGGASALPEWEISSSREFPYPVDTDGVVVVVHDYYSMLTRIAELPLEQTGDVCTVHVATSDGPQSYELELGPRRSSTYKLRLDGSSKRRKLAVDTVRLDIRPTDAAKTHKNFLGMEGDLEVWLEAESKTLLRVSGRVPKVGRVTLELNALGG